MKRIILILSITFFYNFLFSQNVPQIISFSPNTGVIGTLVTIQGENFDADINNNSVFFGTVKSQILSATQSKIEVYVPVGASYKPITIITNGLATQSKYPFIVTFECGGIMNNSFFNQRNNYGIGQQPFSLESGDMDGDGKIDIVITNTSKKSFTVFRNTSVVNNISFDDTTNFFCGDAPTAIDVIDIDGDGLLDVVVTDQLDSKFSVFRNNSIPGIISFEQKIDFFLTGTFPRSMSFGDINSDGKLDIIIGNYGSNSINIFINNSQHNSIDFDLNFVEIVVGNTPWGIATGDINNDNLIDIVVSNYGSNNFSVLINESTINTVAFASRIDINTALNPFKIALSDLDNDGNLDVVISNDGSKSVSIFRNTTTFGNVSFDNKIDYPVSLGGNFRIADIDGDGNVDIAVTQIDILKNRSTSTNINFTREVSDSLIVGPRYGINVCDIDGDGKVEILLTAGNVGGTLTILKNNIYDPSEKPIASDVSRCGEGAVDLMASGANTNEDYKWYDDSLSLNPIQLTGNIFTNQLLSNNKTYYVSKYKIDSPICESKRKPIKVIVNQLPVVEFQTLASVCVDANAFTLNAGMPTGGNYVGNGVSNNVFIPLDAGVGQHILTYSYIDNNGCQSSDTSKIEVYQVPLSQIAFTDLIKCPNDSVLLTANTDIGSLYEWFLNNNTIITNNIETINALSAGTYTVLTTAPNGCSNLSFPVDISNYVPYSGEEICAITVDSVTGNNLIIWNKTLGERIAGYNIYREIGFSGNYQVIGNLASNVFSTFIDTVANTLQQSYRYKISAIDSCGTESSLSNFHRTIHLSSNIGINGEINLSWNRYEGFNYSSFSIYRSVDGQSYQKIGQVTSNDFTYSDLNPPAGLKKYFIEIENQTGCTPSAKRNGFSSVRSNILDILVTSDSNYILNDLILYPNPTSNFINIETQIELYYKLMNIEGKEIMSGNLDSQNKILNVENINSGVYILQLSNDTITKTFKVVKKTW